MEGAILWHGMLQSAMAVMVGAALTTIRHTRTEEASGRNELITIPFGENNVWPLFVFIVLSALPILLAYVLLARRDMGAGLPPIQHSSDKGNLPATIIIGINIVIILRRLTRI